jgi:hypothetical protein
MFKNILSGIWNFSLKRGWNWVWSKTTIDEKAVATVKEIKKRYKLTAQELADVADAIKEVGNQIGDLDDAAVGKKRRGRPRKEKMD